MVLNIIKILYLARVEVKLGIRDFNLKIMRPLCAHVFFFNIWPIFFKKKTWADFFRAHFPPMFFFFSAHVSAFPNILARFFLSFIVFLIGDTRVHTPNRRCRHRHLRCRWRHRHLRCLCRCRVPVLRGAECRVPVPVRVNWHQKCGVAGAGMRCRVPVPLPVRVNRHQKCRVPV